MSVWWTPAHDALIAARCLRHQLYTQRRHSSQAASSLPPSGAAKLPERRLISLHGPDTSKFLQGITTNNVTEDATQPGFFAAFLNAQGKVLNDVFVYPTAGSEWQKEHFQDNDAGHLVEVDAATSEQLFKHMKRHRLRSKFKLRLLDEGELDVWSAWKDDRWTAHTKAKGELDLSLIDGRAPGMGQRLLLKTGQRPSQLPGIDDDVEEVSSDIYKARRYMRGVPEGQHEIPREESLPMNYNFDLMGAIDFKKGCYIGQELTIRTHHTGVVRRRVLPVQLYQLYDTPPAELSYNAGSTFSIAEHSDIRKDDSRRRATGKLIACLGNIGLALCRVEQMTDLNVSSETSSFSPDDKFVLTTEKGDVGVRAFVPDFFRGRIRDPKVQKRVS